MDLPREIDDYIKESIDYSLGLPVSQNILGLKLQASEEARRRLRDQYLDLQSKLKEKDQAIDRAKVCFSYGFPFMYIYMYLHITICWSFLNFILFIYIFYGFVNLFSG